MTDHLPGELSIANLMRPDVRVNPYPFYARIRAADPIYRDEDMRVWVVTRHSAIATILREPQFSAARMNADPEALEQMGIGGLLPLFQFISKQMLFTDPPDHTRLRRLVNKAFTPRVIEAMRGHIQQIVDELFDAVATGGELDVIRDLAYPLPTIVIAEMLGVPPADRDQFKKWSDDFAVFLGEFQPSPEQMMAALRSIHEMSEYFRGAVAELRRNPRDNLLGAMAAAEEQGDRLTEEELLSNALLLLAAGHETTTNLIGNGVLALLQHPDQLELLRDNPSLIEGAIEEILRYESPVQITSRIVRQDQEFEGRQLWHNQFLMVILGAGNRDPEQFADPDRFDISRKDNRHLAFGMGPHFCLGAPLARLEGQIAIGTLLRRFPTLRLTADRLEWLATPTFRGLRRLPVATS